MKKATHFGCCVISFQHLNGDVDDFTTESIRAAHHRAKVAFSEIALQLKIAVFQHKNAIRPYHVVNRLELLR